MAQNKEEDVAMQTRCVHCKREQYAMAVYSISYGESCCAWCGKESKKMTNDEWLTALKKKEQT